MSRPANVEPANGYISRPIGRSGRAHVAGTSTQFAVPAFRGHVATAAQSAAVAHFGVQTAAANIGRLVVLFQWPRNDGGRCGSSGILGLMDLPSDAEVYRKHADELIRFATVLVGPSSAEDVLAAAVLSAMEAPQWSAVENRRAYLYRCVASEAMRSARTAERRLRRERRAAPREATEDQVLDRDVLSAMLSLSARQRAVVYLTYWLDLTALEVAGSIGSSERTVERELERSRQILGRKLS